VRAQGRLVSEDEFADIVLRATPDGSIVLLRDVGRIASTFGPASSFPLASAFTGCQNDFSNRFNHSPANCGFNLIWSFFKCQQPSKSLF